MKGNLIPVFGAIAFFMAVFFVIFMVGKCIERLSGACEGNYKGQRLVRNRRYGTRNIGARLKLTHADLALQSLLNDDTVTFPDPDLVPNTVKVD
mmetsp:Transcript_33323/g.55099  ORF Transcript_33323/g.55099 Transcript_33323/m.55099 type:complete len:94 (+) Transcript_33323:52-333(+)